LARPGLRPVRCRSDFGAGFLRSPSLDGSLEALRESDATCRSNSAIRSACADTNSFSSTTNAANSSYEGGDGGVEDTRSTYRTTVTTPHRITAARAWP
jgi:hypothetical protein